MAKIDSKDPVQASRRFVICYYLSDDTINIHEPPTRNSGLLFEKEKRKKKKKSFFFSSGIGGGKFLERQRVKKSNQPRHPIEISEYLGARDFYVGGRVVINGFEFIMYDADEYAFKLMEKESNLFPVANQRLILEKLRQLFGNNPDAVAQFEQHDPQRKGFFGFETFFYLMKNLTNDVLVDHEIITLARAYSQQLVKEHDIYSVVGTAQEHLRKNNFENLSPLKENFIRRDRK